MGQGNSTPSTPRDVSTDQLSHELALHFATKCYSHLEITHFKDNFKTLAEHQDGIEYWKEETLCRFLCIPASLRAGSVLYQMCSYLGAFPFPSLAPCILTREAMLKVITIMTGRYKKVLKRGQQDKIKLLFRSLAVFDRRASVLSPNREKPSMSRLVAEQKPDDVLEEEDIMKGVRSHIAGFAVDEPGNDDEEEDDDDLVLAALDSLDAIEVFREDQKVDRRIHQAHIPSENLRDLLILLLAMSSLRPQDNLALQGHSDPHLLADLGHSADSILEAFEPDKISKGVRYGAFVKTVSTSLPQLFDPLNALFEHFLFSKNIDLSKHRNREADGPHGQGLTPSRIVHSSEGGTNILTEALLAQMATFASVSPESSAHLPSFIQSRTQFHPLYSTASHGTSTSSFSRHVLSWSAASLLLVTGNFRDSDRAITLGAYLPKKWTESTSSSIGESMPKSAMFQLSPKHAVFPSNAYNKTSTSYFSDRTGLALGCVIPSTSRTRTPEPALGPVSLIINSDLSTCIFQHDGDAGAGAFLTDPILEEYQRRNKSSEHPEQPKKIEFEIDALEVWGVTIPDGSSEDEVTKRKKKLDWDEAEAARRRGVNFGGDKEGARALLEMAGVVGDDAHNRSGGSV